MCIKREYNSQAIQNTNIKSTFARSFKNNKPSPFGIKNGVFVCLKATLAVHYRTSCCNENTFTRRTATIVGERVNIIGQETDTLPRLLCLKGVMLVIEGAVALRALLPVLEEAVAGA